MFFFKTIVSVLSIICVIVTPSVSFHHSKRFSNTFHKTIIKPPHFSNKFNKIFNFNHNNHNHFSHHWTSHWDRDSHEQFTHHAADKNEPKIDIRWDFEDNEDKKKENKVGLDGCKFRNSDFSKQTTDMKRCKVKDNVLIIKELDQNWCFGFYSKNLQQSQVTFSLDRGYRIQYTPGTLQLDRTGNFNLKITFQPHTIYAIILRGNGQGVPSVIGLKINGEQNCEDDEEPTTEISVTTTTFPVVDSSTTETVPTLSDRHHNRWKEQYRKVCGRRKIKHSQLISNGMAARPSDWPWHAAVYHATGASFKYKCGGTLISHSSVLSAGHCVLENGHQIIPERVKIQLGKNNLFVSDPNTRDVLVFNIIIHPDFNSESSKHDIAVIKLAVKVSFTPHISPACLPDTDFNIVGLTGTAIGWGRNELGELPENLHQAPMIVPSPFECLESNRDFFGYFLNEANFCAGYRNGTTVCAGDSGGGLFFKRDEVWVVRGIVSIAVRGDIESGCQFEHFILFTDVGKHLEWIYRSMGRF